jgi:hypothetical protein
MNSLGNTHYEKLKAMSKSVDCYVPTPPSPVPRAASKFLFNAHPAKHAAIKYKMKLMTNSGVAKPLPIPKAIAATNLLTTPTNDRSARLLCEEES